MADQNQKQRPDFSNLSPAARSLAETEVYLESKGWIRIDDNLWQDPLDGKLKEEQKEMVRLVEDRNGMKREYGVMQWVIPPDTTPKRTYMAAYIQRDRDVQAKKQQVQPQLQPAGVR